MKILSSFYPLRYIICVLTVYKSLSTIFRVFQNNQNAYSIGLFGMFLFSDAADFGNSAVLFVHTIAERGHIFATRSGKTVHKEIALCSKQPAMMGTMGWKRISRVGRSGNGRKPIQDIAEKGGFTRKIRRCIGAARDRYEPARKNANKFSPPKTTRKKALRFAKRRSARPGKSERKRPGCRLISRI